MWCVSKWARHALLWCCYKSLSRAERRVRGMSSHTVAFIISFIINAINKIQSFIYMICLCHYVMIYEGSLSCDYQLLRKRGSGDVFQLLLMDPRNFPRWQKRSGWWVKGMKRQIVVNEDECLTDWVSLSRFWYESSTPTSQELSTEQPYLIKWVCLSFMNH